MSNRLWVITDWDQRAHASKYCVKELARQCDVPVQTLRRYLRVKFEVCPKVWLRNLRMERARFGLVEGMSVKQVADELGYASRCHFARDFKAHHGHPPSKHLQQIRSARDGA